MNSASRRAAATTVLAFAAVLAGCIVSDQLTTVTIHPDGSADLVKVQLNVHSSESGARAEEELRAYYEEFSARKDADHVRITEAGGRIEESRWIRSDAPFANSLASRLPDATALEKAFTFRNENGESLVTAQFTLDGRRRRFTLTVTLPPDQVEGATSETTIEELRTSQANGISETRLAVTSGKIVRAQHFTVASDQQSALLEPRAILDALRTQRQVEAFIEWDVVGK